MGSCRQFLQAGSLQADPRSRFFEKRGVSTFPNSREAAKECSPRRKPWVARAKIKPRRGESALFSNYMQDQIIAAII
jgi:hypothetical protein